jgi:ribosomal protein L19
LKYSAAALLQQLNQEVVNVSLAAKDIDSFKPGDAVEVQVRHISSFLD